MSFVGDKVNNNRKDIERIGDGLDKMIFIVPTAAILITKSGPLMMVRKGEEEARRNEMRFE